MSFAPLLVLLTCVVASVSYIGAVTQPALATMVLPLVVVVGVLAALMRLRPVAAVWTVVLVAGAGGEAVNVLSGSYQGSVARSAGVASLATGLAVVISTTRRPALFLVPVAAIVAWALALGAGGRVELVAVVTAPLALLTLAAVERDRREFVATPRLAGTVLVAFLLVVAAGVFAAQFQLHHDLRHAASPFRQSLATTIEPPAILSLTRHPPPSATRAAPPPAASDAHRARLTPLLSKLARVSLALLGLLVALVVGRLAWVALAWRRLRRRLQCRAAPREAGAWVWALTSLDRMGSPVAAHVSPDIVLDSPASEPLLALARTVTLAVFAPPDSFSPSGNAWPQAAALVEEAWQSAGRLRRVRARWHGPRQVSPHKV
jgi:hypothetical protein